MGLRFFGGSAPQVPTDTHPIEMRGGGYDIAMRGGQPMVGWRPLTDDSFISLQLKQAINRLSSMAAAKNSPLDGSVKGEVDRLIGVLEGAETAVKQYRDKINNAYSAVASGNLSDPKKITLTDLPAISEAYEAANKLRSKTEGKLLRIVAALGKEVQEITLGM